MAALFTHFLVLKAPVAVEYRRDLDTVYYSRLFVFELFSSSVLPLYVLVFCHIVTACNVL